MAIIKVWPILHGTTSKGGTKIWNIHVADAGHGVYWIVTKHGLAAGKQQEDIVIVSEGKNIGRSNETTAEQQAIAEAEAKWTKKQERDQYSQLVKQPTIKSKQGPMLALKFAERKHNITYPAYVQPKLNGVRVLAHVDKEAQTVKFMSRKGTEYVGFDWLKEQCLRLCESNLNMEVILDGEFFNPDLSLQEIVSRVKREKSQHEDAKAIQYHIYDIANDWMLFFERLQTLQRMFDELEKDDSLVATHYQIFEVPTVLVKNEGEIAMNHQDFSALYEGTMVRNAQGKYKFGYRSADLLKLKDFEEEEFEIVGVHGDGKGREAGLALFVCRTEEGAEFTVRPRGSFEYRAQLLADRDELIGKPLTVRFLEWSADKVPQHPVGLVVREYE